ncbi:hypothetical protein GQF01_01860 [Paenibacillus sp. 5J-6]|uniref:Aerobactin siderophore biosynthesis IucA/IucC-like C-terminal domain-containing protein n=1 Tax=Paenibacillus silvestris TaxID=2606219 RepID=A0A6L8US68_9BACL|nr:(2Fe-2S)-binding protein [Paenibacillus silvestris]MZQ80885.1 hypothetical protein [Paenibacillus silvestris]
MTTIAGTGEDEFTSSLQKYFVTSLRSTKKSSYPYSAADLMEPSTLAPILAQQSALLGNAEKLVVGTLFAKRFSVFIMGLIAAASLHDTLLSAAPNHIRFRLTQGGAMAYETEIADASLLPALCTEERVLLFQDYVMRLQNHVEALFQAVALHTSTNIKVMWTLVSHNLQQLYVRLEADQEQWRTSERLELIRRDRAVLFEPLDGNRLGVQLRIFEHPDWHGPRFYLRRHCCLAYQIDHGTVAPDYCTTCPKLTAEDRLQLLRNNE